MSFGDKKKYDPADLDDPPEHYTTKAEKDKDDAVPKPLFTDAEHDAYVRGETVRGFSKTGKRARHPDNDADRVAKATAAAVETVPPPPPDTPDSLFREAMAFFSYYRAAQAAAFLARWDKINHADYPHAEVAKLSAKLGHPATAEEVRAAGIKLPPLSKTPPVK